MAIYHLSVSNVSRASGSRATATLSYITGKRVHDERRGETYDYGRKERVLRVGTLLPEGAPAEYADPAVLFNAVELHETGRTARPAKKIVVALPREFTPRQRVQALEEYIRENLNADGYAATYAIHEDREGNNPHAHILVANRQIDPATGGWARLKQRMEYVLDERGERVPLIDPETGRQKTDKRGRRQWKRTSVSLNPLDRKAKLKALRESWANTCNARLDETARIDHRSLEDQGSDLEPTIHEGYAARAIERAGGVSERCEANREIRRSNGLLTAIRTELGRIFDRLGELFAAKIRQLRQRPSGAPQAPSSPEPAERPQERPQLVKRRHRPRRNPRSPSGRRCSPTGSRHGLTSGWPKTNANRPKAGRTRTWRRHGNIPTADPLNIGMGWGTEVRTDSACENAGNAKGRHPNTLARNLERHPYQRVTDTPSTPEPSAVAMRIHGPAATGVYVTPLIAKVICPDLLPSYSCCDTARTPLPFRCLQTACHPKRSRQPSIQHWNQRIHARQLPNNLQPRSAAARPPIRRCWNQRESLCQVRRQSCPRPTEWW